MQTFAPRDSTRTDKAKSPSLFRNHAGVQQVPIAQQAPLIQKLIAQRRKRLLDPTHNQSAESDEIASILDRASQVQLAPSLDVTNHVGVESRSDAPSHVDLTPVPADPQSTNEETNSYSPTPAPDETHHSSPESIAKETDHVAPALTPEETNSFSPESTPEVTSPVSPAPASEQADLNSPASPASPTSFEKSSPTSSKANAASVTQATGQTTAASDVAETPTDAKAAVPNADAALAPVVAAVHERAANERKHGGPGVHVASAQAAAISPAVEQNRSSAVQTVATLDSAKAEELRRDEFKAKLKQAIDEATPTPKTESAAEELMTNGAKQASEVLSGRLATERDAAAGPMKAANATEVPASSQPASPVAPLKSEPVGSAPAAVSAAPVVPAALPPERLDYSADRGPTSQIMAENNVTEEQMQEANDPAFGPTISARTAAEKHEASAAAKYRKGETSVQAQTQTAATEMLSADLAGLHGVREQQIGKVVSQQLETKGKNAQERQRITETITGIKDKTRADVEVTLKAMEENSGAIFKDGLTKAETAFNEAFDEAKGGLGTRISAWFSGDDWEVHIEQSLATARQRYMEKVNKAIDDVATEVEAKLKEAKQRVADGRMEAEKFVDGLDASVKQFGDEALQSVSAEFDTMEGDINQRRDGLIDKLTDQYKASYERMSAMEDTLREENKSLWQQVYDSTVGLVKQISEFKNMLVGVLGQAADVLDEIIAHPIRFLGNLVAGVKQGVMGFLSNIGTYLQKGLLDWLFGALAQAGIQMPEKFDLSGLMSVAMQVLGLTWTNIRKRAVGLVGENVVKTLETGSQIIILLATKGVTGIWDYIKEEATTLLQTLKEGVKSFIMESVIMAGAKWLLGLLNPASAFFKACMAIYDIVTFIINKGQQILNLVNAVLNSVLTIAKGNIAPAAKAVEAALASSIPVAIGFLASLLGIGDLSQKIKKVIDTIQAPINKVIDWLIKKAVDLVKAIGGLFGIGKEKKDNSMEEQHTSKSSRSINFAGERHTLSIHAEADSITPLMSSTEEGLPSETSLKVSRRLLLNHRIPWDTHALQIGEYSERIRLCQKRVNQERQQSPKDGTGDALNELESAVESLGDFIFSIIKEGLGTVVEDATEGALVVINDRAICDSIKESQVRHNDKFGIRTLKNAFLNYEDHETSKKHSSHTWRIARHDEPQEHGFWVDGDGTRVVDVGPEIIKKGGEPASVTLNPFYKEKGYQLGHLIARSLGGPGGEVNIVAIHATVNQGVMASVEKQLVQDIKQYKRVYKYRVKPLSPFDPTDAMSPPKRINIAYVMTFPRKGAEESKPIENPWPK